MECESIEHCRSLDVVALRWKMNEVEMFKIHRVLWYAREFHFEQRLKRVLNWLEIENIIGNEMLSINMWKVVEKIRGEKSEAINIINLYTYKKLYTHTAAAG